MVRGWRQVPKHSRYSSQNPLSRPSRLICGARAPKEAAMRKRIPLLAVIVLALFGTGTGEAQAAAGPAPGETLSASYRGSQRENIEYNKIAPIKVFDNLHHVGPG